MSAAIFCTTFGAYLLGWVLPEMVLLCSPVADKIGRVPSGINYFCAIGCALLAYGLRA